MNLLSLLLATTLGPFAADWQQPLVLPRQSAAPQCAQIQQRGMTRTGFAVRPAAVELTAASLQSSEDTVSCHRELPLLDTAKSPDLPSLSIELDLSTLSSQSEAGQGARSISTKLSEPTDTSGHDLLTAQGCSEVRTPLDSVAPAAIPGVALAVVPAGRADAIASRSGAKLLREIALDSIGKTLALMASENAGLLALLAADPEVEHSQPDYRYRTAGVATPDPLASLAYAPKRMGLEPLLQHLDGRGVRVAVIDTGVAVSHPDLTTSAIDTLDATGAGYVAEAHGTAVVGVIAASVGNGEGSFGIAPSVEILSVRACSAISPGALSARCRSSALAAAVDLAIQADVDIINLSLTGPPDALLADVINAALRAGILVVGAAGNGGPLAKPAFPAALPGVFAVTATDVANEAYSSANRGSYIDVSAPGVDILAPGLDGRYPAVSGTSFAAAQVTAVLALLIELTGSATDASLTDALRGSAYDLGVEGPDEVFGVGLIDGCNGSAQLGMPVPQCPGAQP